MKFKTCVKLGFGAYFGWMIAKGIDTYITEGYGETFKRKRDEVVKKVEAKFMNKNKT